MCGGAGPPQPRSAIAEGWIDGSDWGWQETDGCFILVCEQIVSDSSEHGNAPGMEISKWLRHWILLVALY